jgi:NADPH:quinone reductase-like Zn-dependent oxidoreductase
MRAIEAETFSGYGGLRQTELPKPQPVKDRVLVRVTAAGVTPLDHTILSGGHPRAKAPLVLGNGRGCHRGRRRVWARCGEPRDVHGTLRRW